VVNFYCSVHKNVDINTDLYFWITTVPRGRVWRYQRGNQNPFIEEQTMQRPKEKVRYPAYQHINVSFLK